MSDDGTGVCEHAVALRSKQEEQRKAAPRAEEHDRVQQEYALAVVLYVLVCVAIDQEGIRPCGNSIEHAAAEKDPLLWLWCVTETYTLSTDVNLTLKALSKVTLEVI